MMSWSCRESSKFDVEGRGGDGLGEEISASSSVVEANLLRFRTGSSIAVLLDAPALRGEARMRALRGEDMARELPYPQTTGSLVNLGIRPRCSLALNDQTSIRSTQR